jgi:hypothetical protein
MWYTILKLYVVFHLQPLLTEATLIFRCCLSLRLPSIALIGLHANEK